MLAVACDAQDMTPPTVDAGYVGDAGDASSIAESDAAPSCTLACEQCDASAFSLSEGVPVVTTNACAPQEITSFAEDCWPDLYGSTCVTWAGTASGTCRVCLAPVSAASAAWGAVVDYGATLMLNVGGCVDVVLDTIGIDGSCGAELNARNACKTFACAACGGEAGAACAQSASENECAEYYDAVASSTGACAPLQLDARPSMLADCFPSSDPTSVAALLSIFCGAGN